jgi:hypothetical protein
MIPNRRNFLRTATISVANDDSDENSYEFAIQGTGTIVVTPDAAGDTLATAQSTGLRAAGGTASASARIGDGTFGDKVGNMPNDPAQLARRLMRRQAARDVFRRDVLRIELLVLTRF